MSGIFAKLGRRRLIVLAASLVLAAISVVQLERARSGIEMRAIAAGTTPATLYQKGATGPLVIVAHGFAGSRQLMEAFSLSLAHSGFRVVAFDFQGHGRNPVPMSGDVTAIEGTTARLVNETRLVIDTARDATGYTGPMALLGHSMATDVIIRAGQGRDDLAAIVAVSMFSEAVTPDYPQRLLVLSGQWEPYLRAVGLEAARQVDATAQEGETVVSGDISRRTAVAPFVEHVGVLYSAASLREARDWLAGAFDMQADVPVWSTGPWLSALMISLVALMWPLAAMVGQRVSAHPPLSRLAFSGLLLAPALLAPVVATQTQVDLLPVMVADGLAVMVFVYGALQLIGLRALGQRLGSVQWGALAVLVLWGIGVFGLALDRYGASFMPIPERWPIIAALAIGTVPFMLADAALTQAGHARFWRRMAARLAIFAALGLTVALDPERFFFVVIIFPVLLLFFCVHGLMGRWIGQQAGAVTAGIGLGVILAWALGVSFPLFDAAL